MMQQQLYTNSIHYYFADFICNKYNCNDEVVKALLFCVSYMTSYGHSCLSLVTIAHKKLDEIVFEDYTSIPELTFPDEESLHTVLMECHAVKADDDDTIKPIVYDNGNCYLYRYFNYEEIIAQWFLNSIGKSHEIDMQQVNTVLETFEQKGMRFAALQKIAQLAALHHTFCVISGGPGTGKTTTVAGIVYQLLTANNVLSIALCAPTGKAASRLKESMKQFKDRYCDDGIKDIFPVEASTIHRLLGYRKGALEFYYNEDNRLPYDVVIVDESSMVDIALLAKLIKALKEDARFIVVGDKDQLSSVEAGAFFGDLCWGVTKFGYTSQWNQIVGVIQGDDVQQLPSHPVRDAIVVLSKAYRFGADSGIAVLAQAVRDADMQKVGNVLKNSYRDVEFIQYGSIDEIHTIIKEYAKQHYESVAIEHNVSDAFSKISRQCIVTPFNQGPWGVSTLNSIIEKQVNPVVSEWYHGKIVMVTANDYNLQLYNGDIGIFINNNDEESGVYFPLDAGLRKINPLLLSEYVPAYTITIHKSQGSEFNTVIVLLPNDINSRWSMLLTRELLYTAITRAKEKLILYGTHDVIAYMVNNPTKRTSGIQGRLWQ